MSNAPPVFVGGPPIWEYRLVPISETMDMSPEAVRDWERYWDQCGMRGSGIRWGEQMAHCVVWEKTEPRPGLDELRAAYLAAWRAMGKAN